MMTPSTIQGLRFTEQGEVNTVSIRSSLNDQINKINQGFGAITDRSQVSSTDTQPITEGANTIGAIGKLIADVAIKFIKKDAILSVELTNRDILKHISDLELLIQSGSVNVLSLQNICQQLESSARSLQSFIEYNREKLPIYYSLAIAEVMQETFLNLEDEKSWTALSIDDWKLYFSEQGPKAFHVHGELNNISLGGYYFKDEGVFTKLGTYPDPQHRLKEKQLFYYMGLCKFLSIIKKDKKFMESVFMTTPEKTISIENAINGFCDVDGVKQYGSQTSNLDTSMIYGVFAANFKAFFLDIVLEKRSTFKK